MFYKITTERPTNRWYENNKPTVTHDIPEEYIVDKKDLCIFTKEIGKWSTKTYKCISLEAYDDLVDKGKILWPSEGYQTSDNYRGCIIIRTKEYGDILTYLNHKLDKDMKGYCVLTSAFQLYENDWYSKTTLPKRNIKIFKTHEEYRKDLYIKENKSKEKKKDLSSKKAELLKTVPSFCFETPKFKIVKVVKETEKINAKEGDIIQGVLPVIDEYHKKRLHGIGTMTNWIHVYVNGNEDKMISPVVFQDLFFTNYQVEIIEE